MPTLDWIGKKAVINHHRQVPYRLLHCDPDLSAGDPDSGNLLVQGDNLEALKALLPYYAGQVKCIYIDPPYNTGEQGWTYNDHVDSPEMRWWLQKTVGREGEDLCRHDKWLSMMYPRMALLVQFLREDGFLFVSLDDTEIARFRLMIEDGILSPNRYVATFIWKSRRNLDSRHKQLVSIDHEYVVAYHGGKGRLRGGTKDLSKYSNPDNDLRGPWMSDNLVGLATKDRRPNLHYDLVNPANGIVYPCPPKGWRYSQETMYQKIAENRILWPSKKTGRPRHKKFFRDLQDEFTGFSSLIQCGNTNEGTEELTRILGNPEFIFPKPRSLIETLIEQSTDDDDIVFDSFAGTGTTGHAILSLNKNDRKRRRFVLIEMDASICSNIARKRLCRAMDGYEWESPSGIRKIDGLGGGFQYCILGNPLFDENGNIAESVSFGDLAAHVFFTETGVPITDRNVKSSLLGVHEGKAVYLLFNGIMGDKRPHGGNVLTGKILSDLAQHDGPKVIYGEGCRISPTRLRREGIVFKQVPYEIKVS
ncbi:MAG: site-specific DNA-methyltransferase [Thermodesulfobacteriota bacterium]